MLVKIGSRDVVSSDDEPVIVKFTPHELELFRQMPVEEDVFFSYPPSWSMERGSKWTEEHQAELSAKKNIPDMPMPAAPPPKAAEPPAPADAPLLQVAKAVPEAPQPPEAPKPATPPVQPQVPTLQRPAEKLAPPQVAKARVVPPSTVLSDEDMMKFLDGKLELKETSPPKPAAAVGIPANFQIVQPGKGAPNG